MTDLRLATIGQIGTVVSGSTPKTSVQAYWEAGTVPWLTPTDLRNESKYVVDTQRKITEAGFRSASLTLVPKGTVLLTSRAPIGKVAIAATELCTNQGFKNIVCFDDKVNSEYLYYYLKSKTDFLNNLGRVATFKEISKTIVEQIEIPLPPLETQKRIADALDKTQELIDKRKQQVEMLDEFLQSVFLDMFGDPVTNTLGLETHKLDEYITFMTSGSRGWARYYSDRGGLFIRINNVKEGQLLLDDIQFVQAPLNKEAQRTRVQEGDLLISITADLGRTAVVDSGTANQGAYINQHLCLLRLDRNRISPHYVSAFLESAGGKLQFEQKDQVGVKSGLNFDAIKSLNLVTPPLEWQQEYARKLAAVGKQKSLLVKGIHDLESLFQTIMQKAFKGELFD